MRRCPAQAEVDGGRLEELTSAERDELPRLRHENRVVREGRESLKKAASPIASEPTR